MWSIYAAFTRGYIYRGDAQMEQDYAAQGLKVSALGSQKLVTTAYDDEKEGLPKWLVDRAAERFAAMTTRALFLGPRRWFGTGDWVPPTGEDDTAASAPPSTAPATSEPPAKRLKSSQASSASVSHAFLPKLPPTGPRPRLTPPPNPKAAPAKFNLPKSVVPRPPLPRSPAQGPIFVTNSDQPKDGSGVRWPSLPPALQHPHPPKAARADVLASRGYMPLPDPCPKYLADALPELRSNAQPQDSLETSYLMARYAQLASGYLVVVLGDLLGGPSAENVENAFQCAWMVGQLHRAAVSELPAEAVLPYSRHSSSLGGRKHSRPLGDAHADRGSPVRALPSDAKRPDAEASSSAH